MNCKFCKSFPLIFMQIDRGVGAAEHLVEEDFPRRRLSQKQKRPRPGRSPFQICTEFLLLGRRYFFSSAGLSAGGVGDCAGGVGCDAPDMPSLKLRMPSPNPFMISGMRLPPKKIRITARTTSQ